MAKQTTGANKVPARKPMRQRSAAKTADARRRAALVGRLAAEGIGCEIGPELARHGITVCTGTIQGVHERRKRSGAGSTLDARNLIPACNSCNLFVEDRPVLARGFGSWLVIRPGDDEWELLGRRAGLDDPPTVKLCRRCGSGWVTVPPSGLLACGHTVTDRDHTSV